MKNNLNQADVGTSSESVSAASNSSDTTSPTRLSLVDQARLINDARKLKMSELGKSNTMLFGPGFMLDLANVHNVSTPKKGVMVTDANNRILVYVEISEPKLKKLFAEFIKQLVQRLLDGQELSKEELDVSAFFPADEE